MSGRVLPVLGSQEPWSGGAVTDSAICVLAPNASPWTLDGTNTWLLTTPGSARAVVVDPGPDHAAHRDAVRRVAEERGLRVTDVLLTHGHIDHAEGAAALARDWGVGVRALDPQHRLGDEGLGSGDLVDVGDGVLAVVATPGHSADSLSFVHAGSVLSGDTILGRGTSLVAWPDGRLGDYLTSLARLRSVMSEQDLQRVLPGHGPALDDPVAVVDGYLEHRRARLQEVAEVLDSGVTEVPDIVTIVYADVPREVWPAAELTVRAQVEYLRSGA